MDRREIDASRKKGEKVGCQSAGRLAIDEYAMRVRNRVRRAGEVSEEGGEGRGRTERREHLRRSRDVLGAQDQCGRTETIPSPIGPDALPRRISRIHASSVYFVVVAVDLQLETRSVYVLYALRDEKQEEKKS